MKKFVLTKWTKISYAIAAIVFLFGTAAAFNNRPFGVSLAACATAFALFTAIGNGHIKNGGVEP